TASVLIRARTHSRCQATDLSVAQAVEAEGEDLAGDRDLGDLLAAPLGDPLVALAERAAAGRGVLSGFDQRPPERRRALPGDVAEPGLAVGAADGRSQPRPGAEVAGAAEAGDVADLGDHEHRDVATDAADLTEHLDVGVFLSARVDLAAGLLHLPLPALHDGHPAGAPTPRPLAQLELGEEAAPAAPRP